MNQISVKTDLGLSSEAGGELKDIRWGSRYPSKETVRIAEHGVDLGGSSSEIGVWYPRGVP